MAYQYAEQLDPIAKARYDLKLQVIGLEKCPFQFPQSEWKNAPTEWPELMYPDVYNYLINTPGMYNQ